MDTLWTEEVELLQDVPYSLHMTWAPVTASCQISLAVLEQVDPVLEYVDEMAVGRWTEFTANGLRTVLDDGSDPQPFGTRSAPGVVSFVATNLTEVTGLMNCRGCKATYIVNLFFGPNIFQIWSDDWPQH